MGTKLQSRVALALALAVALAVAEPVLANVSAGGGSRIIGTDFIVELVTVMTSVWVPAILIGTLISVLIGLTTGFLRMSTGMSKVIVIVLLGGVGVSGLLTMLGLDTAVALVF